MDILLVKNRTAHFKIAIPDNASIVEKKVSEELREYIKKATGADVEIVNESSASGTIIYVGHTEYAKKNGISGNSIENWIIKTVDGNIVLTGGLTPADRGVAYSVYHFLEDYIDVHWWNTFEEYVPELSDIVIDGSIYDNKTPAVPYRKIIELFSHKDFVCQARNRMNIIGDDGIPDGAFNEDVKARGGAIYMAPPHHVHSMNHYIKASEDFEKHPDWWAYNEVLNKRIDFGQLCLSSEGLYKAMFDKLCKNIDEQNKKCEETGTEKPCFYSVSFADLDYLCECPECKETIKKSGQSGYLLKFVNRLAKELRKIYPDVCLETLAYAKYIDPPLDGTAPEKNVIIRYADMYQDFLHDLDYVTNHDPFSRIGRIEQWAKICKTNDSPLYIWDYLLNFFAHSPIPQVFRVINNVKKTYEAGITGYLVENEMDRMRDFWALEQWILNRIIEDPSQDGDKLIDTFITRYYGKASSFVKEYLMLLHDASEKSGFILLCDEPTGNWNFVTLELAEKSMELFKNAQEAVLGNTDLERRVKIAFVGMLKAIAVRYFEFKKMKKEQGGVFDLERKTLIDEIVLATNAFKNAFGYNPDGSVRHNSIINSSDREIKVFTELLDKTDDKFPLPKELSDVSEKNVTDVYLKDVIRFIYNEKHVSILEDKEALVDKVMKFSKDNMSPAIQYHYIVTEKSADAPHPISFCVKKKNIEENINVYSLDLYKEDIVADKYHLYKIEGVKGVTPEANLCLYLGRQRGLAVNLSEICRTMPFEECDIYISMKATGEHYGGKKEDENALYLERVIVVKTK